MMGDISGTQRGTENPQSYTEKSLFSQRTSVSALRNSAFLKKSLLLVTLSFFLLNCQLVSRSTVNFMII